MTKKPKIAFFHLAFFYSGGGEKLVLRELAALKKRGYEVDCFTPTINCKLCYPDVIRRYHIKTMFPFLVWLFPKHESLQIMAVCILFPLFIPQLRSYDVIFGANQPGPWFGWLMKKLTAKPYVIYLAQPTRILYPRAVDRKTGIWVRERTRLFHHLVTLAKPFIFWADRISIREADQVLVNGEYVRKRIKKVYKVDATICPAGADVLRATSSSRVQGNIKVNGYIIDKPYLLLTNRHFPQKRFEHALAILPALLNKQPKLTLVVTGNPTDYTAKLKSLAGRLGIAEHVLFAGYVTEKHLARLYAHAAVYVYTSPAEDFGMGVIEAMGSGIPVVAWRAGGPAYTIQDGETGFLVKPYSRADFKAKLTKLLADQSLNRRMGLAARSFVAENYTYKKHIDTLVWALEDVYTRAK